MSRLDLLVRGATVYPGEGAPAAVDVGVRAGLIESVGSLADADAAEVIDGAGAMLCPGFVDLHAHSALASFDDPLLAPKILQGFTTEVINPDGLAPAPVTVVVGELRRVPRRPRRDAARADTRAVDRAWSGSGRRTGKRARRGLGGAARCHAA